MSKKELNAWDRFWVWIKANEKVIWVMLLVLIAPTFAFTGAFYSVFDPSDRRVVVASVFGKELTNRDLQYTSRMLESLGKFRRMPFGQDLRGVLEFLTYCREADRLGIRVTDLELGAEVRQIYFSVVAQEAAMEAAAKVPQDKRDPQNQARGIAMQQAFFQKRQELMEADVFDQKAQEEWHKFLERNKIDRRAFEDMLRDLLKAEKLEEYARASIQVTPQQALEEFKKSEQSRKLSFLEVRADEARAEVEKGVTEEELKRHYEDHREEFREQLKVRADYLSLPIAPFESEVKLTDEDLRKEYDRVKIQKYRTFVGEPLESFDLRTPEEKAALDQKAFRPFEEVKEEVRVELLKARTREAARAAAEKIRGRLYPTPPGQITPADGAELSPSPPSPPAPPPPAPPAPATLADIHKDYPTARTGTTPWVDRIEAEKTLGPEVYTYQLASWFTQAEGNQKTAPRKIEAPQSYTGAPAGDPKHFVFYQNPQSRQAGVPKLDEIKDKVREAVVKEKLLERAKEKAKKIADELREGKKSLEDAGREAGQTVVTTGFLRRSDDIKVPLTPEELKKAEEERKAEPEMPGADPGERPIPKDKTHPGSQAIMDYGFLTLRDRGKVDGFAEDPRNSACYVARWDDVIFPDLADFEKQRSRFQFQLRREKEEAHMVEWRKDLYRRAAPGLLASREEEPPSPGAPGPSEK